MYDKDTLYRVHHASELIDGEWNCIVELQELQITTMDDSRIELQSKEPLTFTNPLGEMQIIMPGQVSQYVCRPGPKDSLIVDLNRIGSPLNFTMFSEFNFFMRPDAAIYHTQNAVAANSDYVVEQQNLLLGCLLQLAENVGVHPDEA